MNTVAKETFFSEAYRKNEQEREHWQREVLREVLTLKFEKGVNTIGNQTLDDLAQNQDLISKLEQHTMETGNDIFSDVIIKSYLAVESNEAVRDLISRVWIGLWDAPKTINAGINTTPFYDGSFLIKFTSDMQILVRKVVELFATEVFTLNIVTAIGSIPEIFKQMLAIELHDIQYENEEIGVKNLISLLPSDTKEAYDFVFEYAFLAGCAFVIFHELGHQIQKKEELAKYFDIPIHYSADTNADHFKSENNADLISMKIIHKMFGKDEAVNWLAYSGILLCLITLAINNPNPTMATDHPSIQDRYRQAKNFIIHTYGKNAEKEIFLRTDGVAKLLTSVTNWTEDNWWESVQ